MMFDIRDFSNDDLKKMQGLISAELSQRQTKRKNELWDNVIRAMKEYCAEFESFEIVCGECGHYFKLDFNSYESKNTGEIAFTDEEEWKW
jgi:hypothetical protein